MSFKSGFAVNKSHLGFIIIINIMYILSNGAFQVTQGHLTEKNYITK